MLVKILVKKDFWRGAGFGTTRFWHSLPGLHETPTFESLFGRLLASNALKSMCFSWEVLKKHRAIAQAALGDCGDLVSA